MRLPWRQIRPRQMVGWLALLTLIATIVVLLLPGQRISQVNFQKIWIGMAQAELLNLLGPPYSETVELGLVNGPEHYSVNFLMTDEEKRRDGFRDYQRQQWISREISIVVISDVNGQVVCRYSSEGHKENWRMLVWFWLQSLRSGKLPGPRPPGRF